MWCDHPFSQRNMTTERAVGEWVRGGREVGVVGGGGWWTKFGKRVG